MYGAAVQLRWMGERPEAGWCVFLRERAMSGVTVDVIVDGQARARADALDLGPEAVPSSTGYAPGLGYRAVKRGVDLVLAGTLFVLLLPVMAVAVVLVKLSGLPMFFRQERVGRGGKAFTVYKFDTMRRAPFELCVAWQDDRVPPLCQWLRTFRIDELPQLWNIVRGDMSIVGPRPLPPDVVAANEDRPGYFERELVKPGLTSWAKVREPNSHFSLDPEMLDDDLVYVRGASLWFDVKILVLTPFAVLRGLQQLRATMAASPLESALDTAERAS
jgi:lipopolysaccharide/colanic/teichoic acid biosynthesis glycosyltransferase